MKNGSPVLIDTSGTILKTLDSALTYDGFLPEGIALFGSRFYTGLMDTEGNEILPLTERIYIDPNPADGCFFSEGKQPVMNDEGNGDTSDLRENRDRMQVESGLPFQQRSGTRV